MFHYNSSCCTFVFLHKVGPIAAPIALLDHAIHYNAFILSRRNADRWRPHKASGTCILIICIFQMQFRMQFSEAEVLFQISDHLRFRRNIISLVITQYQGHDIHTLPEKEQLKLMSSNRQQTGTIRWEVPDWNWKTQQQKFCMAFFCQWIFRHGTFRSSQKTLRCGNHQLAGL